jgi:uncharacterized damage-inducible protein DinB
MTIFNTNELLTNLGKITEENISVAQKKIIHLGLNQLNWSPNQESWNIAEVLAHLNKYASFYHATFEEKINKTRFREPKETFTSSPLGRSAWKSMKLGNAKNIKRRFKSPKGTNPRIDKELITGKETEKFIEQQEHLLKIIESARNVGLRKVKIPISISRIVRLRLGDALMFVIYHNQRHVQQIINLMNHPKFPKKEYEG